MSDATIFYILGGTLAGLAVVTSFIGLRFEKFPGKFGPVIVLVFLGLIVAATTFAVLNGKNEEKERGTEYLEAGAAFEKGEAQALPPSSEGSKASEEAEAGGGEESESAATPKASGPGGTVKLEASSTALAFDTKSLSSKPGKVTIDFKNPAALEHNVAIEEGGSVIAESETITEGDTSVSAELAPGTYTFLCTIPGHAEAGMEGTLTVK